MNNLLTFTSRPAAILFFRIFGLCLLITGLVTAALNITLGGLTPTIWILLGLGSFMGAICNTLFAIRYHIENKDLRK
jgi:hypothetical protein